jgi:hypothetical protein
MQMRGLCAVNRLVVLVQNRVVLGLVLRAKVAVPVGARAL